jgi:hypothetical protein
MDYLIIVTDIKTDKKKKKRVRLEFSHTIITFGRGTKEKPVDIVLDNKAISRIHGSIIFINNEVYIVDGEELGNKLSTHGIHIIKKSEPAYRFKVEYQHRLEKGDMLELLGLYNIKILNISNEDSLDITPSDLD